MTEHGPEADEKARIEQRNMRLKNIALIIGSIAALTASGTSLFSSLGFDKLIARKHTAQTESSKKSYQALVDSNGKLRGALRIAFERIRTLEGQVRDLKENQRLSLWAKLAATTSKPPPPAPDPVPVRTSDPMSLFSDPETGGLLSNLLGTPNDEGLEMLEDSKPLEWEQVQRQGAP